MEEDRKQPEDRQPNDFDLSLEERSSVIKPQNNIEKEVRQSFIELYLNDVYENECTLKAGKDEVDFIQTGIEALVQQIVNLVLEDFSLNVEIEELFQGNLHEDLTEIYFPISRGHKEELFLDTKSASSFIIKVGSFYEGTKNSFPDEFDFIFPYFRWQGNTDLIDILAIGQTAHRSIELIASDKKGILTYASPTENLNKSRKLFFNQYLDKHGPASMLQFIYDNGTGKERFINVDLVPAYKITEGDNNRDWFNRYVNEHVTANSFHELVLSAETCLYVFKTVSFTDIEVHFMRNVLSKKHLKAYRILKFLINGNSDSARMEQYFREKWGLGRGYSSYKIKTMMIFHHDECTSVGSAEIGPCVIQVLNQMCSIHTIKEFPQFSQRNVFFGDYKLTLLPYLQSLTQTLKSLRTAVGNYDYEKVKCKSVIGQYLDDVDKKEK